MAAAEETKNIIYQLFWIFMTGCVAGCLIETIYCFLISGVFMNRSSVLYGPFSIVWGGGAVIMSLFAMLLNIINFHPDTAADNILVIVLGGIIGGVYEYLASLLSEITFDAVHWDYSDMPLNIGGRTNLLFCVFWGIIALIWIKKGYPLVSGVIAKVPWNIGKTVTFIMTVFMVLNIYLSVCSQIRFTERAHNIPAASGYERFLDEHYPDSLITRLYPDIKVIK